MPPVLPSSTFVRPHINIGYGNDRPDGLSSIPELIEFSAKHNPDYIFAIQGRAGEGPPVAITFSQLQSAVECASAWLTGTRSTTGRTRRGDAVQPVAILLASDVTLFIYIAALLRIGTPALILSARLSPVAIAYLLRETSSACVLVSSQVSKAAKNALTLLRSESDGGIVPKFLDALSYEHFLFDNHTTQGMLIPPRYSDYQYGDLDAVILHSSGTTGLPKPIFHSQTYILTHATNHCFPDQKEQFRFSVSTLPLYHGYGLSAPALSLSIGMPFVLFPASVVPTGKSTIAALQSTGARYVFSVPSVIEDILQLPRGLEALKDLEMVSVGGAPMKENIGSELAAAGVNLLNTWGATESGTLTTIQKAPPGYDWRYVIPRTDLGLTIVPSDDSGGTYRLICYPPGWKQPFVIQDVLVANPRDSRQYKIIGRVDELVVLATGEKVRPANMEHAVSEHPEVKSVLAFGDGKLSLGLLIEVAAGRAEAGLDLPDEMEALHASIEPFLERGNSFIDGHGKVAKEMIIFTREKTKPLIRTDKGTLARKANYTAFEEEIEACYARASTLGATPFPLPSVDKGSALLNAVRSLVRTIAGIDDIGDDADFFEVGMDSLQANRLRQSIISKLRVTITLPKPITDVTPDFCFESSSVKKLHSAIVQVMSGTCLDGATGETKAATRVASMKAMVDQYISELRSYADIAVQAHRTRSTTQRGTGQGTVVLLTGSTGSLGCFLLARLANDPAVSKVICLNRYQFTSVGIRQRQVDLMSKRGASLLSEAWEKIVLHGTEMSRPDFGLGKEDFAELLSVTHIIHNAWPVNFNRNLSSFEPHVKALANLVRLSILSAGIHPQGSAPTRLLFTSSLSVAGQFSSINPGGPVEVPEEPLDAVNTSEFGYPEAKWVGESVVVAANELYGFPSQNRREALVRGSVVRIGQMTGAEGSGAWNESEYFPIIVCTSQHLNALPALEGSLSWTPVNRASDTLAELIFSNGFRPFYHIENPSRQSWSGLLHNLASILGGFGEPVPLIPFSEWLDHVRALGDNPERNKAFKILSFLENDFLRTATGAVTLGTANAWLDSPTIVQSTQLSKRHLEEYIGYWKKIGAIQ